MVCLATLVEKLSQLSLHDYQTIRLSDCLTFLRLFLSTPFVCKNNAFFAKNNPLFKPINSAPHSSSRAPAACPCTKQLKNLQILHEIALSGLYCSLFSTLCSLPRN